MSKKVHTVTVLEGDGIGPEVMKATLHVLEATGVRFKWEHELIGQAAQETMGDPLPKRTLESIWKNGVAIKGPTGTPLGKGHRSVNVRLREEFGLYANIRPIKSVSGIKTRYADAPIDIVIFRENLEDLYIGNERTIWSGAEAISRITVSGTRAIAKRAFAYAKEHGRKKVTIVHKANILKLTHGIFRDQCYDIASAYPDVETTDLIADNCFMQLVRNPQWFDVLILPNFLGDLASDLCAGLIGGLGWAAGANIGDEQAIFEAVHGTAPDIAGKGIANPSALILSGAMMLEHLGEREAAERVRKAVTDVVECGEFVTADVNPKKPVSTMAFAEEVAFNV